MPDVLVIGAGVAGVTAARQLARAGFSVTVVEGRDRVGGRVWSIRDFCGEPIEAGAEFIHGVGARTWPEVRTAGLSTRPCPLIWDTMFNVGGGTRWLPWILLHPGVWPTFPILRAIRKAEPPDRTAREFIDAHGYRGRARIFAQMTLTAHLPGSVEEVGVLGLVADGVLRLETGLNHRVEEGYDALAHSMASGLDIRLGFTVASVRWASEGVTVRSAAGEEISSRAAVCTIPVGVLRAGSVQFTPALPESKRAALEVIEMGPVLKLLLLFRERFWPKWAANIACGTGPVTLYWPVFHRSDGKPPVLVAYCTGPRAARLSKLSEDEAVESVLADLRRLFPKADPRRALMAHRRIDWAIDPFSRGGYTFLRPGGVGARERLRAPDTGALFWAGAATEWSPIAATVEAAYSSGMRAAGEAKSHLAGGFDSPAASR
ncbi:MAG: flavin monoamine oxidase family protein [Myxococcota bacterium]